MSKDPGFIFYPGDYLRDTQCLSEKVQVAYDRIMCEHMRNICISQQQLNFFTKRLSPDETEELLMVMDKIEGGYEIGWVAESIRNRKAYSESRRKNREGKGKNICETYDNHMENENENENINKEKRVQGEEEKLKAVFESFRIAYPGTKRGLEPEFENFRKKNKNWKEVIPVLSEKLAYQIDARNKLENISEFTPAWKNLSSWINQKSWTEEIAIKNKINHGSNRSSNPKSHERVNSYWDRSGSVPSI